MVKVTRDWSCPAEVRPRTARGQEATHRECGACSLEVSDHGHERLECHTPEVGGSQSPEVSESRRAEVPRRSHVRSTHLAPRAWSRTDVGAERAGALLVRCADLMSYVVSGLRPESVRWVSAVTPLKLPLAVDVTVHHGVVGDALAFSASTGGSQISSVVDVVSPITLQVLGETAGHVLGGRGFPRTPRPGRPGSRSEPEDVGGPFVQASDRSSWSSQAKSMWCWAAPLRLGGTAAGSPGALGQLLGRVPLEQRRVHGRGADHHGGPSWD